MRTRESLPCSTAAVTALMADLCNIGMEQDVHPRFHGPHSDFFLGIGPGEGAHVECVRHDQSVELHAFPKKRGDGFFRERHRLVRVEGRYEKVGNHHHSHPVLHRLAEGREFHPVQARPVRPDDRKDRMGILVRVPVAGEMLGAGQELQPALPRRLLQPFDVP